VSTDFVTKNSYHIVPTYVSAPRLSTRAADVGGKVTQWFLLRWLVQIKAH